MRTSPVNLASQPVRNERLPALLFLLAAFALLAVTVQHAVIVYRLRPGASRALHAEVEKLREESKKLTEEGATLRGVSVATNDRTQWDIIKGLVDRRTFWWSKLFAVLEEILPRNVRIVSVMPKVKEGERYLDLTVRARSTEAGFHFAQQVLVKRSEFADITLQSVDADRQGEFDFQITARYLAGALPQASPPAAAEGPAPAAVREARQ